MSRTSTASTGTDARSRAALLKVFSGLIGAGLGLAAGGVVLLTDGTVARTVAGVILLVLAALPLLATFGLARDPGARSTVAARLSGPASPNGAGAAAGPVLPTQGAGEALERGSVDGGGELTEGFTVAGNRAQRRAAARGGKRVAGTGPHQR